MSLMNSAWPMRGHDSRNSGQATMGRVLKEPHILWTYDSGSGVPLFGSPVVDKNENIYFCFGNNLYIVNHKGVLKKAITNLKLYGSPVLANDGTIYCTGWTEINNKHRAIFYALSPEGSVKWSYLLPLTGLDIEFSYTPFPIVDEEGIIYTKADCYYYASFLFFILMVL